MEQLTSPTIHSTHTYFLVGMIVKAGISFVEIVVGVVVLILPTAAISGQLVRWADHLETFRSLHTLAPSLLHTAAQVVALGGVFIALYFVGRGVVTVGLIAALVWRQRWAYPVALGALGLLICYQCFHAIEIHSKVILALTLFNLVVLWLIWEEYRVVRSSAGGAPTQPTTSGA